MKTRHFPSIAPLLGAACLTLVNPASAAEFFLRAAPITNTMPDGVRVAQWGFARDSSFGARDGAVTVPGPVLIVPPTDNVLTIRLDNDLPEPISIVINGQFPTNAPVPVRHPGGRVRSFTHETPPGNASPVTYTWSNVRPGTFLYLSGSHSQIQVPMGLYGAMKKDTNNGVAYPGASYSSDVVVLYSEIDPVLNNAVATGNFGPGKAITSTVSYKARYFLINGTPFTNGLPPIPAGDPGKTNLLRFLNASSETHVPILDGFYLRQIAEDGNQYPFPRNQYSVHLPPQKALDALLVAPPAGTYALYDRRLGLVSGTNVPGGMLTYLSYNLSAPVITSQPLNQNAVQGSPATFAVTAIGTAPLSYQWQRNSSTVVNGPGISGATTPTLTLSNVQPIHVGTYSVIVTNIVGGTTSSNALLTMAPPPPGGNPTNLVPLNSVWRYLENGSNQGTAWRNPLFDDSAWPSGPAELGYGDGGEATVIGSSANNYITTYFRRSFTVANPGAYASLTVRILRDDGGIVYLNGIEVFRSNMPTGTISHLTLSSGSGDEVNYYSTAVSPAQLVPGVNVIAVEIHQKEAGSSDLSFNLQLIGTLAP